MELERAVRTRRMCRSYDPDRPVPRTVLSGLLELGVRAPSAGYSQGWHFLILDDIMSRSAFWTAAAPPGAPDSWLSRVRTAPALIICFSDEQAYRDRYAEPDKARSRQQWRVPYWHLDAAMATMIILLGAQDAGLGALFFGVDADAVDRVREAFGVPERLEPIGVISLGYPAVDRRSPSLARGRRPMSEVVSYGSFGSPPA